ncbi:hypothetical protein [Parendozoicomonas haliclonae]|uniref:tRNA(Glu)-specific nuclease WapA n=1 Tax=Parendozoicomonas haliclonae TaxID=1960125 RepID=A0A1X7AP88_9GAMM|nr:hypothetical protein [Parendozoicomonas haliclonae]SMA49899.1 tRNA(Glu)-specific nuclease WapA precursor [Parendozoicomonas haliclonae]
MVAIISSSDLGLFNHNKVSGQASTGQGGQQVYVNANTGNLVLRQQDEIIASLGLDTALVRTYNSQGSLTDANGDNTYFSFNQRLINLTGTVNQPGSTITRVAGDGSETLYKYDSYQQVYVSTDGAGAHDTLRFESGQWVWQEGSTQMSETYTEVAGVLRMVQQQDAEGRITTFGHNAQGQVVQIADASGQRVSVQYSGQNVTGFSLTSDGITTQKVYYQYDNLGRLTSVKLDLTPDGSIADGKVYTTTYQYDGNSRRIQHITQSDGSTVSIAYVEQSSQYRVSQVTTGSGQTSHTTRYEYDLDERTTDIVQVAGESQSGPTTSLQFDEEGRVIRQTTPADINGQRQITSYTYDADGNLTQITQPGERHTVYEYDSRGNKVRVQDPEGNLITRNYSANNQLTKETVWLQPDTDGAGPNEAGAPRSRHFIYDSQQRLRFTIEADGSVEEIRYDDSQSRARIVSQIEWHSTLSVQNTYTLNELQQWVASQNAQDARRVDTTLDFRGQVSRITQYSSLNAEGYGNTDGNHSTTYTLYDAWGRHIATVDPRGTGQDSSVFRTEYTYDGMGRRLTETDALGHTTTWLYQDNQSQIISTAPNGLQTTRLYDSAGRLISQIQTDTSNTARSLGESRNFYDSLGRLRATQDASGATTHQLYDNQGRLIARLDSSGTLTELIYNEKGQLEQEVIYAKRVTGESLTRLLVKDDSQNITGINEALALSDLRPDKDPNNDRSVYRYYNDADRLRFVINGEGYTTEYRYNGAGERTDTIRHSLVIEDLEQAEYNTLKARFGNTSAQLTVSSASASQNVDPIQHYSKSDQVGFDQRSPVNTSGSITADLTANTRPADNDYQDSKAWDINTRTETEVTENETITDSMLVPPKQPYPLDSKTLIKENYTKTDSANISVSTSKYTRPPAQSYTYSTQVITDNRTTYTSSSTINVSRGDIVSQSSIVQHSSSSTKLKPGSMHSWTADENGLSKRFSHFEVTVSITPIGVSLPSNYARSFTYNYYSKTYDGSVNLTQSSTGGLPTGKYSISVSVKEFSKRYEYVDGGGMSPRSMRRFPSSGGGWTYLFTTSTRTESKGFTADVGSKNPPTILKWTKPSQPFSTSVRFYYRTSGSGSYKSVSVSTSGSNHQVSIPGLANRNYDYRIEYIRNGVIAQQASGVFSGSENLNKNISTSFSFDYASVTKKTGSALTGYSTDIPAQNISTIKAVVKNTSGAWISTAYTSPLPHIPRTWLLEWSGKSKNRWNPPNRAVQHHNHNHKNRRHVYYQKRLLRSRYPNRIQAYCFNMASQPAAE